ncbi:MAG: flagellar biosynthetic protein FliO [Eubacterium sp.]|nr:flagellar biosynthetic protein FliO [Eubacterium sp.]
MSVLAIFVVVLLLTWLTTRWIAGYQQGQMHNQNLRIVETLKLTVNNYIQIVEVGDIYLVIAVNKDHIEKLAEITKDQLKEGTLDAAGQKMDMGESFRDILDKVKHHLPKK